jgi:cobalt-zinc-cadmium efflux system outer membrane protein
MRRRSRLLFILPLLCGGCLYGARERTDRAVLELAARPFDPAPAQTNPVPEDPKKAGSEPEANAGEKGKPLPVVQKDIQTTSLLQAQLPRDPTQIQDLKSRLKIPEAIPGSETPLIPRLPADEAGRLRAIRDLYPELPELPEEPKPLPGPDGQPYTLAALQQIAAANSPTLRQAAADVQAALGNLDQARAYPNPTVSLQVAPSNDGSTAGVWGIGIDQPIKTFGKLRLAAAAAQKDLDNAELALRRARSDLATQVRNAYFALLVAREGVRINRALAQFTDDVYRIQAVILEKGGQAAPYEPAALRAQAYSARLAYKQSIQAYLYAWKQLLAALGLRQLPLSEVAGRIDAAIPYYDYDAVLAHVLRSHTDVLTARNGIDKARYNLKSAQITPLPDVDLSVALLKEFALAPEKYVHTVTVGVPFPVWDRNKGAIFAAEAAVVRAGEEPHRVELNLTTTLATNYTNYKTNLDALEYYRKFILPDQVRYYRGVFQRRDIDPAVGFGDLVTAQQALASSVTQYLAVLGQVWTSVVSVADLLQTDDLFQLAEARPVPALPDLELPPLPCCHPAAGIGTAPVCAPDAARPPPPSGLAPVTPAPMPGQPRTPYAPLDLPPTGKPGDR